MRVTEVLDFLLHIKYDYKTLVKFYILMYTNERYFHLIETE
jgi:hypothetical protein